MCCQPSTPGPQNLHLVQSSLHSCTAAAGQLNLLASRLHLACWAAACHAHAGLGMSCQWEHHLLQWAAVLPNAQQQLHATSTLTADCVGMRPVLRWQRGCLLHGQTCVPPQAAPARLLPTRWGCSFPCTCAPGAGALGRSTAQARHGLGPCAVHMCHAHELMHSSPALTCCGWPTHSARGLALQQLPAGCTAAPAGRALPLPSHSMGGRLAQTRCRQAQVCPVQAQTCQNPARAGCDRLSMCPDGCGAHGAGMLPRKRAFASGISVEGEGVAFASANDAFGAARNCHRPSPRSRRACNAHTAAESASCLVPVPPRAAADGAAGLSQHACGTQLGTRMTCGRAHRKGGLCAAACSHPHSLSLGGLPRQARGVTGCGRRRGVALNAYHIESPPPGMSGDHRGPGDRGRNDCEAAAQPQMVRSISGACSARRAALPRTRSLCSLRGAQRPDTASSACGQAGCSLASAGCDTRQVRQAARLGKRPPARPTTHACVWGALAPGSRRRQPERMRSRRERKTGRRWLPGDTRPRAP